jgi:hypothetical protein
LLSLKMSIDEIAAATGSTPNALRVLLHRIVAKTEYSETKDFIRSLRQTTNT